jgi:pilus assembly protein CpaF
MIDDAAENLERFGEEPGRDSQLWLGTATDPASPRSREAEIEELKARVHERLLDEHDPGELAQASRAVLRGLVDEATAAVLQEADLPASGSMKARIAAGVIDELCGYGPIQPFLDDPTITEVMVNGARQIYIERGGVLYPTDRVFRDDAHVMRVIERIVAPIGRRIDEASPMVDARLPDGSRVNAIIPPLSLRGPVLTVRKFSRRALTVDDLVHLGTMTADMMVFLQACVVAQLNMLISGGTGSGKTTTLNALSAFIPNRERIVTIEDAAELQLQQEHVVPLESRPANLEGKGEVTIRMLVRNALRMRPDRIIVGEVRGGEALDMLQAMNTGHDGSLSTLHSNSPRDSLARLETMTLMAGVELPAKAIREQIASALHLIIHQNRLPDGTRRITHITEVQGMEGDIVVLQDIFRWEQQGVDSEGRIIGHHVATGLRPRCLGRLLEQGAQVPLGIFAPAESGRRR